MNIKHMSKLLSSSHTVNIFKLTRRHVQLSAKNNDDGLMDYVMKAAKAVNYPCQVPTSGKSDELQLFLQHLPGTNRDLMSAVKDIIVRKTNTSYEPIVLLFSKAAGVNETCRGDEYDPDEGVLHDQRILAHTDKMIRTSHALHNSLTNTDARAARRQGAPQLNAVHLLTGDHLLTVASGNLVRMDMVVRELMASSQRDLAESQFIGPRTRQNEPLPCKPAPASVSYEPLPFEFSHRPIPFRRALGTARGEWTARRVLGGASILAKTCQGCLRLAGHCQVTQQNGHIFGRSFDLLWQASKEIRQFSGGEEEEAVGFSLVAAPILFHLQQHPEFYDEFERLEGADISVDYGSIREVVRSGPGIQRTVEMKDELSRQCLDVLDCFEASAAKDVLVRLIESM